MEITVDKEVLRRAVQQVSTAIQAKSTIPILNNILFEVNNGKLTLYASNMDFSIRGSLPVENVDNFSFTIPGRTLLRILSTLEVPVVKIVYENRQAVIKWDKSEYTFPSMPTEDFPKMKDFVEQRTVTIETETILEGYSYIGFCVAKDDPRPFLNGILLEVVDGEVRLVASDAHKLGLYINKVGVEGAKIEAILGREVFDFIESSDENSVTLSQDKGIFSFAFSNSKLVTRLIEGPYAPYREVIPKDEGFVFKTSVREIEGALKRIQEVVPQNNAIIEWSLKPNGSVISGVSESGKAKEYIDGEYDGEELRIGFNVRFLHDIIKHLRSEEVKFNFYGPKIATKISPVGIDNPEVLYLLMPVSLE